MRPNHCRALQEPHCVTQTHCPNPRITPLHPTGLVLSVQMLPHLRWGWTAVSKSQDFTQGSIYSPPYFFLASAKLGSLLEHPQSRWGWAQGWGALLVQGGTQKPPGPYAAIQAAVLPALPCSCYLTVLNLTHRDEQSADAAWTCFAVQMHFHRVSLHAPLLPSARRIPLGFVSLTGTTGALMSNAGVHFLPCLPIQHKCQHADRPAGLSDGEWINIWSYKAWEEPFCTHTARHTWDWVRLTDRLLKRSVPMDQTLQNELILHTGWYFFKLSSSVKKKSKKRKRAACFDTNFQKRHVFSNSNLS